MVIKDTHIGENLASMDTNNHRTTITTTPASANANVVGRKRAYMVSLTTLCLLAAFFLCTVVSVAFIIYNFATCEQLTAGDGEEIVCTTVHTRHSPKLKGENDVDGKKYETDVRLPRAIKPLSYNLTLVPYLLNNNFTFEGEVKIRILILEDCYNITMHATDLNITKNDIIVRHTNATIDKSLNIRKQYLVEAKQFFIIELYDKLKKDSNYEITIKFNGVIGDFLQGFYRSSYQVGNETRWLASTQFQATDARRAFPCFDEPALKAKFTLTIARPINMSTISNMPIISTKKHETLPNYMWDYFAESLPMSTYLVAYAISDFSHLSSKNFNVWARTEAIESAQYALSIGPNILKFLEEFFDIRFPLPKIDMIALPDFPAGAMENWGLITYREATMLFDEGISATTNKQRIASVVGHELAHQWFGNLVTPSWWSDIWLNEGFASYMEYITVDAIEPEWRTLDQFVVYELQNVFQLDALSSSHKISVEVFNPDEISEIFDRISYSKGSTIIRMMSHFLTSKVFRRGLSNYLREMAYNSASQDDLWRFLTNEATASGLLDHSTTVKQIMDTWTLQVGYPVVRVVRNPNNFITRLEQQRFHFVNTTGSFGKRPEPLWWIPITYTTSDELNFNNTRPLTWIPRKKVYEIENRNLSTADWFIFNIQQTGYYRINYDPDNWQAITNHLKKKEHYKQIAPANRAQLIDDAMNLARGGYLSYDVAFNLTQYLSHELDLVPWKAALNAFSFIDSMFVNQGDYDLFKNYVLKLLVNVYNDVGFEDDAKQNDMLRLIKRFEILNMACHLGHRDCISESTRLFQNWIQEPNPDTYNPISPNLRSIVYCSAIQYGTELEWNFAFERYIKSSVSTEKEILLTALGCSKEPWILYKYLRHSIDGTYIRKQDIYRVFAAVSNNVVGQQVGFDFVRDQWQQIKENFGNIAANLNTIINIITKKMNTRFLLQELEVFVKNDLKEDGRTIKQSIEQVEVNVEWMNRNYKSIVGWLKNIADVGT